METFSVDTELHQPHLWNHGEMVGGGRTMTMLRALTVALVAAVAVAVLSGTAEAGCVGPGIEHPSGTVDRGGTVHVVGQAWGDNCYDTGPPPPGEGVLGHPLTGIKVYLAQGGIEHLVATGDADQKFGFVVDVPVPDTLEPGPVELVARSTRNGQPYSTTTKPLVVSQVAPSGSNVGAPVQFDKPTQTPEATTTASSSSSRSTTSSRDNGGGSVSAAVLAGVALITAGLVAAGVYLARRRRR